VPLGGISYKIEQNKGQETSMPVWKILIGRALTHYYANDIPVDSINIAIQRHVADGWTLQGDMMQLNKISNLWMQRVVKPAVAARV